ncbi:TIGR03085 family metal-binding protein [Micromonospora sp. WMMD1082]|uniref:TIGR03085 family metal-binding protein n=1 Tax=Micromonospora sp. WMMD1082 TaxID=3016104 RepID=UPI002416F8AD|nr:TIGR03085 family metal-binding protein [Micromonospora sp. WMMD1082]MDG4796598.1 TIGR03085 family metal-binding protein [Micromonospora sp. WMMD1082]
MPRYARSEREALTELMSTLGPDAPTLDEGWTTRDLAAHLVIRERRPDAAAGIALKPLRNRAERIQREVAALDWAELLDQVRRPPVWSPVSNPLTDELANTMEFFIHHEDVRRAQADWRPRELPVELERTLWRRGRLLARMALRRFPARLLVQAPGHGEVTVGRGGEPLRLAGTPGELVLFLSGRQRATRVECDGPPALVDRLRGSNLGF